MFRPPPGVVLVPAAGVIGGRDRDTLVTAAVDTGHAVIAEENWERRLEPFVACGVICR